MLWLPLALYAITHRRVWVELGDDSLYGRPFFASPWILGFEDDGTEKPRVIWIPMDMVTGVSEDCPELAERRLNSMLDEDAEEGDFVPEVEDGESV